MHSTSAILVHGNFYSLKNVLFSTSEQRSLSASHVNLLEAISTMKRNPARKEAGPRKVTFCDNNNSATTLPEIETPREEMWYTKDEMNEMARIVRVANVAVNDVCGDLDVSDSILSHREAVLKGPNSRMAKNSKEFSEPSCRLARLHALILEKDILSTFTGVPVSHEMLWPIIKKVMPPEMEEVDVCLEDDIESIGTIEDLEDVGMLWDEDDDLPIDEGEMEHVFDEEGYHTPGPLSNLATDDDRLAYSTALLGITDYTPNTTEGISDNKNKSDGFAYPKRITSGTTTMSNAMDSTLTFVQKQGSIEKARSFSIEGSGADNKSTLLAKTTASLLKREVEGITCGDKATSVFNTAVKHGANSISEISKKRDISTTKSLGSLLASAKKEDGMYTPPQKRMRTSRLDNEACPQYDNDQYLPNEHRCHIADAMISLARWEFRAHTLPIRL